MNPRDDSLSQETVAPALPTSEQSRPAIRRRWGQRTARTAPAGRMLSAMVALAVLAGCGNGGSDGESSATPDYAPGPPAGITVPADAGAGVGWATDREGELWVLTQGSSTNPLVATEATADGQTVTITLGEARPGEPATSDLVPTTSYIAAPEGVDSNAPVTVVLGDLGTAEILDAANPGWLLFNS